MAELKNENKIVGYVGIILPDADFYQGYFLLAGEELDARAVIARQQTAAISKEHGLNKGKPLGAMQGAVCELAAMGDKGEGGLAVFLRAISIEVDKTYYLITGNREAEGWRTDMTTWDDVEDAEHARLLLETHPLTVMIQKRLTQGLKDGAKH